MTRAGSLIRAHGNEHLSLVCVFAHCGWRKFGQTPNKPLTAFRRLLKGRSHFRELRSLCINNNDIGFNETFCPCANLETNFATSRRPAG